MAHYISSLKVASAYILALGNQVYVFQSATDFMEKGIFSGVEVFSSLCYPSLSRIGETSLCFPTHKCPGSAVLLNPQCVNWIWLRFCNVNEMWCCIYYICAGIQMKHGQTRSQGWEEGSFVKQISKRVGCLYTIDMSIDF